MLKSLTSYFAAAEASLQVCPTNGAFTISHYWKTRCRRRPALIAFKTRRRRFRHYSSKSPSLICKNIKNSKVPAGFHKQERTQNLQKLDHSRWQAQGQHCHPPEQPCRRIEVIEQKQLSSRDLNWNISSGNISSGNISCGHTSSGNISSSNLTWQCDTRIHKPRRKILTPWKNF